MGDAARRLVLAKNLPLSMSLGTTDKSQIWLPRCLYTERADRRRAWSHSASPVETTPSNAGRKHQFSGEIVDVAIFVVCGEGRHLWATINQSLGGTVRIPPCPPDTPPQGSATVHWDWQNL